MSARPTVVVCRGCCCGTTRRVPGRDHDGDLERLRDAVGDVAHVRVSDCLGPCDDANVVVVIPSRAQRAGGQRPRWFRNVTSDARWREVVSHVMAGQGPGRRRRSR